MQMKGKKETKSGFVLAVGKQLQINAGDTKTTEASPHLEFSRVGDASALQLWL